VGGNTQCMGMGLDLVEFFVRKASSIDNDAVHFIAFFFCEVFYTEGGVQAATETENNFF
jgi:hypothetical protein